ncbi:hypothetical protein C8J55DRAFT_559363 [Lentinula edodes]|uniref:Uncharacterized protein n=1 Tax=Lentinula lateritia TaxID=40482 RepID=A0A9W9AJA4_9AGAR|nr:hypothetical protein C8J55DRAFT_559363 [Lentinula edodes]
MRFIGVYLFLALVSVGFAVPLSADKDAERSLNLQAASRVDSVPFGTRNFYDTSDDEDATKQETPKKQEEAPPDAQNKKKTGSKWRPSWMGRKKGGDKAKDNNRENGEGSKPQREN